MSQDFSALHQASSGRREPQPEFVCSLDFEAIKHETTLPT